MTTATLPQRLDFQTHPDRYRHWNLSVDGDVATVWTRYDFFIDGAFSHGGTDVIVLLRTDDGWRIASLVWTVETDPEPSPLGPPS